jgi:release factor glutamine methyltransferase
VTTESVTARLRAAGCVFAEDEAAVLVEAAQTPAELDAMVERRAGGEPLEQVAGWAEFCGLRVFVDPGVFVPRRRSEFLVSVAVGLVRVRGASAGTPVIVDLCCGTGALGLAVATGLGREPSGADASGRDGQPGERAFAEWTAAGLHGGQLHAADLDLAAVACARRNVEPAGGRVYQGDLFDALPSGLRGRTDVLICNAPYVPTGEIAFMPAEAREHEALLALDGGADGLAVLRRAAAEAGAWLAPAGVLLVETSERQAPAMAAEMAAAGLHAQVRSDDESGATVVTGAAPAGGAARTLARKVSLREGTPLPWPGIFGQSREVGSAAWRSGSAWRSGGGDWWNGTFSGCPRARWTRLPRRWSRCMPPIR